MMTFPCCVSPPSVFLGASPMVTKRTRQPEFLHMAFLKLHKKIGAYSQSDINGSEREKCRLPSAGNLLKPQVGFMCS